MTHMKLLWRIVWTNSSIVCLLNLLPMVSAIAASVNLSWSPNNPAPEGYRVYARKSSQHFDYGTPIWEGSATACTLNNLDDQTEYFFVIQPFDGDEEGDYSAEIRYVTPASNDQQIALEEGDSPLHMESMAELKSQDGAAVEMFSSSLPSQGIPLPPVPLSAEFSGEFYLVLSLDDQTALDDNPPAATHWQICETQSKHCVLDLISDRQLSQLRVSSLSLKNGIEYYWRARFFNSKGRISDWSEPHFFTSDVVPDEADKHRSPT